MRGELRSTATSHHQHRNGGMTTRSRCPKGYIAKGRGVWSRCGEVVCKTSHPEQEQDVTSDNHIHKSTIQIVTLGSGQTIKT